MNVDITPFAWYNIVMENEDDSNETYSYTLRSNTSKILKKGDYFVGNIEMALTMNDVRKFILTKDNNQHCDMFGTNGHSNATAWPLMLHDNENYPYYVFGFYETIGAIPTSFIRQEMLPLLLAAPTVGRFITFENDFTCSVDMDRNIRIGHLFFPSTKYLNNDQLCELLIPEECEKNESLNAIFNLRELIFEAENPGKKIIR